MSSWSRTRDGRRGCSKLPSLGTALSPIGSCPGIPSFIRCVSVMAHSCRFIPYLLSVMLRTVPQLGLLNGISLYPKVSDLWFAVFAAVFISGSCQHLFEVLHTGGSFRMWWNELRIWMIKSVSANFFGCLDFATKLFGVKQVDFGLTSKVTEEDQVDRYTKGVFDFQGAGLILVPVVTSSILNMAALIGGVWRVIVEGNYSELMMAPLLELLSSPPSTLGLVLPSETPPSPFMYQLVFVLRDSILYSSLHFEFYFYTTTTAAADKKHEGDTQGMWTLPIVK
ncbi:Cellulose synthase [Cinnamomum micranthum f. kanehirae]|uniref:Cellulose synthase n=1 Tax=Cinnamomum micranthum f. kanehirae TaxID=337451 RepID=A0A3S3QK47_9MAGN|nr:Cellulose synthase [Cinnamomum micranthum f. kanehirae]